MIFNPDRFLANDPAVVDPVYVAFGYGRRICPGRFMAEGQLWISIACILSAFVISPGKDENGQVVTTEAKFASGLIWYAACFFFLFPVMWNVDRLATHLAILYRSRQKSSLEARRREC